MASFDADAFSVNAFSSDAFDISATTVTLSTVGLATEHGVRTGDLEIYLRLAGDSWISTGFDDQRQAIINGITASGSPVSGWNTIVKAGLSKVEVTRLSGQTVRINITDFPAYRISENETITATVPGAALELGDALVATPNITITAAVETGTEIVNSDTFTDAPNNYLICERTGFKIPIKEGLRIEWDGTMVRSKSFETRHPQDFVRSRPERFNGSPRPEQDDKFIGDQLAAVTVNDL